MRRNDHKARRICFVTGTRAEFGLMRPVLQAIRADKRLRLQIIVTGMHLAPRHGQTLKSIRSEGWRIDAVVGWPNSSRAVATGKVVAALAERFARLKPDIVLIVGDRVEAFAAAAAGHLCDIPVAHIHGGDRALGQMDDSLRHAVTKLAHVHFPATKQSASRIASLGEDDGRIHVVGSPGIDGIQKEAGSIGQFAGLRPRRFALVALHPVDADEVLEFRRAKMVLRSLMHVGVDRIVIIYPNNDPGAAGIIRCWRTLARGQRFIVLKNAARPLFLALLRDAAMMVGNSSSGIIEAASFRTPVIDIGPRQLGRQRCKDVRNVPYRQSSIAAAARTIWNRGWPRRGKHRNPYGGDGTGKRITGVLKRLKIDHALMRKLISY
jgi:GDP/UDP-N,N'-diacetylbacillosamine 2-epimerase (hydrolysing)